MEKIACYIRVSTEEQKLHGISLDAQRDKLKEYAENHHLKIVEWYEDEGVSGRKLIKNRPELQRMLNDAQKGKFDRIIFIKLDRFFRSVAEYHECMKLIDPVLWTATEEKYDLTTANGRAFVNMKLTIAELEADQTGERIKIVNDYKVKTGQAVTGAHNQGYAFTVRNIDGLKRVVKDPDTEDIVTDFIRHFLMYQNKRQSYLYIKNKYDTNVSYQSLSRLLLDTKLYGYYKGNDDYCEPYLDKKTFDKIQSIVAKNIKVTASKRVYLFSGLIKCPCCSNVMSAKFSINYQNKEYLSYRCNKHYTNNICNFNKQPNEDKIEQKLIESFEQFINVHIESVKIEDKRIRDSHASDKIKEIKAEMERTTKAYRKGRMKESDYDREYDELEKQLKELQKHLEPIIERDLTIYENLLKSDWRELYNALDRTHKRAFWRKYIKEIQLNLDGSIKDIIFF